MTLKVSKPLGVYFFLAYLFSWIIYILLALNHRGIIFLFPDDIQHGRVQDLWHSLGGLGPAIAAVLTLKLFFNKDNFNNFLESYSVKKLTATGWLISLSPILYLVFAVVVSRVINHEWFSIRDFFQMNNLFNPLNFLAWLFPSITYGFGEEAGWRGFALPVLQKKYSAFISSTILTLFWVGWHVPSFWYRYDLSFGMFIGFVLGIWAGALYLTFLFNYTKGSLLAVSIWHFTWDVVSMIGKEGMIAAIMSTLIMFLGVFVIIRYKGRDLSPFKKVTLYDDPKPA